MENPQNESPSSDVPRFDRRKLAEAIAAVHGVVPIVIQGKPFDPAVASLLRKMQEARSIPPNGMFRCKREETLS